MKIIAIAPTNGSGIDLVIGEHSSGVIPIPEKQFYIRSEKLVNVKKLKK
tara:strand:+ start:8366 stop:8512 length:147 start_codon:yes stop_codon:yes gene_type:complete